MQRYCLLILFVFISSISWTQTINTEFGKNRVQYHDNLDAWWKYETQNFITYWYGKAKRVGQSAVQLAELDHDEIQKILEHRMNDKIEIIVYTDLSDLKQSNIGVEDVFINKPKTTKVVGNKVFVFFDGNHQTLREDIKKGIANVFLNSILLGSNFQELVQNAILLSLPEWFNEGLIAYAGSHWNHRIDDELRDIVAIDADYYQFGKLSRDHPRVAGHSFWFYIDQKYGKATISNVIYLTRLNRQIENSFTYILGVEFEQLIQEWSSFYKQHYDAEEGVFDNGDITKLDLKNKSHIPVSQLKLSHDGSKLAYAYNDLGKYKVVLRDLKTGKEKVLFKKGTKNLFQATDYNYPLICWHPNYPELTIVYEHRDIIYLRKIDTKDGEYEEQSVPENFQRIQSVDYINAEDYVFAAIADGYSDIYEYRTSSRGHTRLTNDFYDDLDASYTKYQGEAGVLFSSNRKDAELLVQDLDTILPIDHFDLFFLKIGSKFKKDHSAIQITKTPKHSELSAIASQEEQILFLSDKSGINNRYVYFADENKQFSNSNKDRNIILHDYNPRTGTYVYTVYNHGAYEVYIEQLDLNQRIKGFTTPYQKGFNQQIQDELIFMDRAQEEEAKKILPGQLFQSEFEDDVEAIPLNDAQDYQASSSLFEKYFKDYFSENVQDGKKVIKYNSARANAARRNFKVSNTSVRMDNEPLFDGLESYSGDDKQLTNVPVGILISGQLNDLFEDYQIEGGARYPLSFNGSEYFLVLDRRKRLLDHRMAFYRKTKTQNDRPDISQIQKSRRTSWLGMYRLSYPFDVYRSVRLTGQLRFDKYFNLASDDITLNLPTENEKRLSIKAEYVFDNAFDKSLNIKNGSRYKAYVELIKQFNFELNDGFNVNFNQGFTAIVGFDARHYVPVLKHGVFALRGAGASSLGSKRMLYYVGGVQNWISPKFDEGIPLPQSQDFAYKALAPNLRGFRHNIRNGSNYLLSSAELRFPVLQTLGMKKVRFSFLKNFQVVGFFDAGMAWFGWSPYGEENQLNTVTLETPPVITVQVEYFRDPLVYGYGFGFRTTVLGYYLKFDYAWGVETKTVQDPRVYFSLGYDF